MIRLNRDSGEREMVTMRWGLVPYFAKILADWKGFSTINARAETVQEKALWRGPFEKRRCLIPADGFYARPEDQAAVCLQPEQRSALRLRGTLGRLEES